MHKEIYQTQDLFLFTRFSVACQRYWKQTSQQKSDVLQY